MKLSILTPSYNSGKYLERAILSVMNQNCQNFEHIIVDGGSDDDTIKILNKYPHVKWISEPDKGQSDAMNKAIALATGNVLSFLNADDYYEPNVFSKVIEIFEQAPNNSLLVGDCNFINELEEVVYTDKPKNLRLLDILSTRSYPANPASYFYHKSIHNLIGYYDIKDHYVMDLDFILRAVQVANVIYIPKVLGNFFNVAGTKTHEDRAAGKSYHRREKLINNYKKQLSVPDRIYFEIYNLTRRLYFISRLYKRKFLG